MSERLRLQPIELILVAFGLILFLSSLSIFLSEISLRRYLLGWQNEGGLEKVGIIEKTAGGILRKKVVQAEFKRIGLNSEVYNFDTIVTGPDSTATVELSDGSAIELAPKTMIKLVFESRFSLAGISRATTVNVVSGKVKGKRRKAQGMDVAPAQKILLKPLLVEKAAPEKIIEIITQEKEEIVQVELPAPEILYQAAEPVELVDKTVTELPKRQVIVDAPEIEVEKKVAPVVIELEPEQEILYAPEVELPIKEKKIPTPKVAAKFIKLTSPKKGTIFRVKNGSTKASVTVPFQWEKSPINLPVQLIIRKSDGSEVLRKKFNKPERIGRHSTVISEPGRYSWEISDLNGAKRQTKGQFQVAPTFLGLKIQEPLVGGQKKVKSNLYTGKHLKDFDITLLWEPFPGTKNYSVKIFKKQNSKKPLVEKSVRKTSFLI